MQQLEINYSRINHTIILMYYASCNLESDDDPTTTVADTGMGEGSGM